MRWRLQPIERVRLYWTFRTVLHWPRRQAFAEVRRARNISSRSVDT
jgi:hypothetical protein